MESLDTAIKSLLRVINQIQLSSDGSSGLDFMNSSKPYWHLCVEKFHAAYIKSKNPGGFVDMFNTFFEKHQDKFTEDVVDEEGDINDEWLKNKEVLNSTVSKKKKTVDSSSFSLRNIKCRGEVIYFDESNEKIRNVSIPISEAYLHACKIYANGAKKGEYSPLPAQLLLALFTVMMEVCDDESKSDVKSNVKALKDVVEQLTNGEEQSTSTGATLDPIGGLMKKLTEKFGGGKDGGFDMGNLEKTVSGLFNDEITDKVKGMWNTFNDKVNLGNTSDLSSVISSVTDVMKDPSIQAGLQDTLASVAAKVGFGEIKFTSEEEQKIKPEGAVVDEQE